MSFYCQRFLEVKLSLQSQKYWQILCQIDIRSANPTKVHQFFLSSWYQADVESWVDLRLKCLLMSLSFYEIFWQGLIRAFFLQLDSVSEFMSFVLDVGLQSYSYYYTDIYLDQADMVYCHVYLKSQTLLQRCFFLFWLFYPHKVVPHITIGPSKAGTLDGSKPWIAKSRIKVLPGILPGCIKASIIIQCYTFLEICTIQDTGRNKLPSSTRIAHTTQHQRCSAWICLLDAIPDRSICPSPTIQTPKVTTTWYPSMF